MLTIRAASADDRRGLEHLFARAFGAPLIVRDDEPIALGALPAFLALDAERRLAGGLAWMARGDALESAALVADPAGRGAGTRLIEALEGEGRRRGARRLTVCTTNDNLSALAFYQRRGFQLAVLRPGAAARARRLKPGLPLTGAGGLPLRDELILVKPLI